MTEGTRIAIRDCQRLRLRQLLYKMSLALGREDYGEYFEILDTEFEESNYRLLEVAFDDINGTSEGVTDADYDNGLKEFLKSQKSA